MNKIKKIIFLLTQKERKILFLLLLMNVVMAFFEMLGVISIMPFIAVLTMPELIHTNDYLISLYKFSNYFGIYDEDDFLYLLGVMVFILLITSLSFKAFTHYAKERFVEMRIYSICKRFMEGYMN